jgi:hypothetical protein
MFLFLLEKAQMKKKSKKNTERRDKLGEGGGAIVKKRLCYLIFTKRKNNSE